MRLKSAYRVMPLAALSATEMIVPFIRMFFLTHILGPYEFGFSAAISAAYATVEQITDTALFRFVLASPRERYREALATAHGIALIRGILVAGIFVAIAYPTSCAMVTCGDWPSFMWLAALTLIKSFENLELRVYERDYRYWPQLVTSIASHSVGLTALIIVGLETGTHNAIIAYLIAQSLTYVTLTHVLARTRYSLVAKGPLTRDALHYCLPLMANGVGLALMGQGDRLFVGAALGVETLGLYAIMILTAYVPTSALFRLIGPIQFAGLINSVSDRALYVTRLRLFSRTIPMIAAVYSLGWIVLGPSFIPTVFGDRFTVTELQTLLVGLIVYCRICRTEPATSLLLQTHGTGRLAIVNQLPMFGLALGIFFIWLQPSFESLLFGTAIGELVTLSAMLAGARAAWRGAWRDAVIWCAGMALFPAAAGLYFVLAAEAGDNHLTLRVTVGLCCGAVISAIALASLTAFVRKGYGKATPAPPLQAAPEPSPHQA